MEKVLYCGPTGIRWHCTKFSHASSFALGVCATLYWCVLLPHCLNRGYWHFGEGDSLHLKDPKVLVMKVITLKLRTLSLVTVCSHFYSFLYASCLLVEKVTLAACAVRSSIWYRNVGTMQGTHTKCSSNLVNRESFVTRCDLTFFMLTGAREVWAQAPTLGMAVRAEGALLAAESHRPVWQGSSYILLLLWSGKQQCFIYIYVLYCNFQTQS
jgi:hypothetical protein